MPFSVKHTATPPQPLHFYKGNGYSKNAKTTNGTKKCSYFTVSYDARRHDSQKEREPRNSKFNCGICTFWKEPGSPKALFWDRGHAHTHTDRDESAAGRAQCATRACARADFKKYPVHGALLASPPSLQCTFQAASHDSRVRFEVRSLGGRDVIRGEGCDSRGWCLQKKPRQ